MHLESAMLLEKLASKDIFKAFLLLSLTLLGQIK